MEGGVRPTGRSQSFSPVFMSYAASAWFTGLYTGRPSICGRPPVLGPPCLYAATVVPVVGVTRSLPLHASSLFPANSVRSWSTPLVGTRYGGALQLRVCDAYIIPVAGSATGGW